MGYSSWVSKESDTTEQHTHTHLPESLKPSDGNGLSFPGTLLSCLLTELQTVHFRV